jgi:hypothetical protein
VNWSSIKPKSGKPSTQTIRASCWRNSNRSSEKNKDKITHIEGIMQKHYKQIKDELGIEELLAESSEDEMDTYIGKCLHDLQ